MHKEEDNENATIFYKMWERAKELTKNVEVDLDLSLEEQSEEDE